MTSLSDRQHAVALIREAQTSGARLVPACKLLGLTLRTLQRWVGGGSVGADKRPEAVRPIPSNKLSEAEQDKLIELCNRREYRSMPPAFMVADQADRSYYWASESTFYRVMKARGQQNHRGAQKAPQPKRLPTSHTADGPCQVWCWDISWLPGPARGHWFYLYLMLDVFSRKIVGHEVYESETGELAADVVEKACWREHIAATQRPLILHSDNGSPMKASTFQDKLYDLGITQSRSRPRVSNDNAYAESIFKTLKYRPGFPSKGFADLSAARDWVHSFVQWYNTVHRHSGLNYVTPQQRHDGTAAAILAQREEVFTAARTARPERWSGSIRNFELPEEVHLNPEKKANC